MEEQLKNMVGHGIHLFQAGKYHQAIDAFERAICRFQYQMPDSDLFVTACYKKGLAQLQLDDYKGAARSFLSMPHHITLQDGVAPKVKIVSILIFY